MSQKSEILTFQPSGKAGEVPWSPDRVDGFEKRRDYKRLFGRIATVALVAVAAVFGHALWNRYMGSIWTRDGTVRAYVATVAPEVSGNIVAVNVSDNQFVRKGDLLLQIDPTTYTIAVRQAEAALAQAKASLQNGDAEIRTQEAQIAVSQAQLEQAEAAQEFAELQADRYALLQQKQTASIQEAQQYRSQLRQQQAAVASAKAGLVQAERRIEALKAQRNGAEATVEAASAALQEADTNLERTTIRAPISGWVTNLHLQTGNLATSGRTAISIVNADSFWVDAYFEETALARIKPGEPALIKLMGYDAPIKGHVGSLSHAIDVSNAQSNEEGVATVNPVFTWVRLAQRIPVRIVIDEVPDGFSPAAGMTATVQLDETKG